MPTPDTDDQDPTLPPPGHRWGSGAQSVLPYLTKSLQAKPTAQDARESHLHEDEAPRFFAGSNRPMA